MRKYEFYFKKGWIYFWFLKWIYISLENPFKTMNKLKGVFKPLECYFRCGKYWSPVLWCSKPSYIQIMTHDVSWKDKYDTPRYEVPPYIWIHLFGFNLVWYWDLPEHQRGRLTDDYWEQALWYLYYYNSVSYGRLDVPNIEQAKESWPWSDYKTKQSTWSDEFLMK